MSNPAPAFMECTETLEDALDPAVERDEKASDLDAGMYYGRSRRTVVQLAEQARAVHRDACERFFDHRLLAIGCCAGAGEPACFHCLAMETGPLALALWHLANGESSFFASFVKGHQKYQKLRDPVRAVVADVEELRGLLDTAAELDNKENLEPLSPQELEHRIAYCINHPLVSDLQFARAISSKCMRT